MDIRQSFQRGARSEACAVFFARDLGALEEVADRAVAEDEGAPLVAIDPATDNVRVWRAYENAGLRVEATVATESGPAVLMPYEPEPAKVSSTSPRRP